MRCPCETCVQALRCLAVKPCRRRIAWDNWKAKAAEIRKKGGKP